MALRPPMASTNPPVNTAKRTYEELEAENARLRAQIAIIADAHISAAKEAATLRAQIEAAAKQEPVAIVRVRPLQSDECRAKIDVEWLSNPLNNCNLYTHPQPAIPEGWKNQLAESMWQAINTNKEITLTKEQLAKFYDEFEAAMLKAAPTPEGK